MAQYSRALPSPAALCSTLQHGWDSNLQTQIFLSASRGERPIAVSVWGPALLWWWDSGSKSRVCRVCSLLNQRVDSRYLSVSYSWALGAGMRMLVMMMTIKTPLKLMNFKILRLAETSEHLGWSRQRNVSRWAHVDHTAIDGELRPGSV